MQEQHKQIPASRPPFLLGSLTAWLGSLSPTAEGEELPSPSFAAPVKEHTYDTQSWRPGRKLHEFDRRSPTYRPGRHADRSGNGFEDTSGYSELDVKNITNENLIPRVHSEIAALVQAVKLSEELGSPVPETTRRAAQLEDIKQRRRRELLEDTLREHGGSIEPDRIMKNVRRRSRAGTLRERPVDWAYGALKADWREDEMEVEK